MTRKTIPTLNSLGARAATAMLGLTLAFGASAQTMGPGGSTKAEVKDQAGMEFAFNRMDIDKDGSLSVQEISRMPAIASKFGELDLNKDGVLNKAEFSAGYSAAQ